jgi:hypothetical protein
MVPSPRARGVSHIVSRSRATGQRQYRLVLVLLLARVLGGCASAPPSSHPEATVKVAASSPAVLLGLTDQISATVTGVTDTSVIWSVNGVAGGNAQVGTIDANGLYTAPADLPNTAGVTIAAQSDADASASGEASITVTSDISVSLATTPASTLTTPTSSTLPLTASISSQGKPDLKVNWSVNGVASGNSTVGTISSTGTDTATYHAPANVPTPFTVTIGVTPAADTTKTASLAIAIAGTIASMSQTVSAATGGTLTLPDGSSVTIPAGLLSSDETLILSEVSYPNQPPNPALTTVGPALVLTFSNPIQFNTPELGHPNPLKNAQAPIADGSQQTIQFFINSSANNDSRLNKSVTTVDIADTSGNNTFMQILGGFDSSLASITGSLGSDVLSGLHSIGSITFSAANFINGQLGVAVHLFTAPNDLNLDVSTPSQPKWAEYASCPSGRTLLVVHGMDSYVEDTFPTNPGQGDGGILNIKTQGAYDSVVGFDYDWTQSILTSGDQLASFLNILGTCSTSQIDIEAHSEGVPVSMAALTSANLDPDARAKVKTLVSVAGPIMGTPAANNTLILGTFFLNYPTFLPSGLSLGGFGDLFTLPFTRDLQKSTTGSNDNLDQIRQRLSLNSP